MNDFACRELAWDENFGASEESYFAADQFYQMRKSSPLPAKSYSLRSSHIHALRSHAKWASGLVDIPESGIRPPSKGALAAAEEAIYNLPEDCLDFDLAISSSGEINMIFGSSGDPLQIFIEPSGLASYYGVVRGEELAGSEVPVRNIPYMKLVVFMAHAR